MLLQIEKKGTRWVITNNPPIKHRKFSVQIDEKDITDMNTTQQNQSELPENINELLELRKKYPQLHAIDKLISKWMIGSNDDELLDEYFKQRAEDEGII